MQNIVNQDDQMQVQAEQVSYSRHEVRSVRGLRLHGARVQVEQDPNTRDRKISLYMFVRSPILLCLIKISAQPCLVAGS